MKLIIHNEDGTITEEHIEGDFDLSEGLEWCECDASMDNAYYVDDTEEMKHHWKCGNCHKIVQIG